jgi:type VI secretion system secreted protein VgrG
MSDENRLEGVQIAFMSGAMKGDDLRLQGLVGREALSRLFEFDLVFSRKAGPYTRDQLELVLRTPCAMTMGPRPGDVVHGILSSIEVVDSARSVEARYLARMVPTIWLLTLSRSNRVFQETTVPQMVEKILVQYGFARGHDFEILTTRPNPLREYMVQYEESDWDFVQRWLEHEGLYYWFEHGGTTDKLIISDTNHDATPIDDPAAIRYRERNNLTNLRDSTVWDWTPRLRRTAARVAVYEYNYRTPALPLAEKIDVDVVKGFGGVFHYGEHFRTPEEGKAVATLRAERMAGERLTVTGKTDCARFRVGHSFQLENHPDAANDTEYLITTIEHRVGFPLLADGALGDASLRYVASFGAMPYDVAFRPERVTPWPSIHGVIHAHIDGDTTGEYAEIDDLGRYKVKLPFDSGGVRGLKASQWVRMAQNYSGAGYGSHFPLHKGTEVLLVHIDGDPDRPLIVGSVPNPQSPSPTTMKNATQSVIQTASGLRLEMEDLQK